MSTDRERTLQAALDAAWVALDAAWVHIEYLDNCADRLQWRAYEDAVEAGTIMKCAPGKHEGTDKWWEGRAALTKLARDLIDTNIRAKGLWGRADRLRQKVIVPPAQEPKLNRAGRRPCD